MLMDVQQHGWSHWMPEHLSVVATMVEDLGPAQVRCLIILAHPTDCQGFVLRMHAA